MPSTSKPAVLFPTPKDLIVHVELAGGTFVTDGATLWIVPGSMVTAELASEIRRHKAALIYAATHREESFVTELERLSTYLEGSEAAPLVETTTYRKQLAEYRLILALYERHCAAKRTLLTQHKRGAA